MPQLLPSLRHYLSLVKFSHTIFALPFAAVGFILGALEAPENLTWGLGLKVLACMVFARNTAMAFNRLSDAAFDKLNPRTAVREIPAGVLHQRQVRAFVAFNALAFIGTTWLINPLCFFLSPVALAVIMGYSYTKRFTPLCHLILGLGLALAPVGAFLAVTAHFDLPVILLGAAVLTWVGGFDIIYALQDESFDRHHRLHSLPAWLGGQRALMVSRALHLLTSLFLVLFALGIAGMVFTPLLLAAILFFLIMLIYQHSLVTADDLRRVNLAFFTANGLASLTFGVLVLLALLIGPS
jgi:4-hydroxybenzoate polyprenyltransferase